MKRKKITILFLGGAKRVSLAEKFIEEGKKKKLDISIFSYELEENVPISFIGKIIIGLKWNDENLYAHLLEAIELNGINIVIPFLDYATVVAAKLKRVINNVDVFIPVSDENRCAVFFNKSLANDWCAENDIKTPSNLEEYPLIAKPITGSASKGILILESSEDLDKIDKRENYLIQKFIRGKEFSVDIYVSPRTNNIISIVPRERIETQGGESIKSITVKSSRLVSFSKEIIEKSKLVGPITLQLIEESETKDIYFIEINPRYGGAVLNSIYAGANSVEFLLNDFLKIENSYNEVWQDRFLMIRRFSEYYKICK